MKRILLVLCTLFLCNYLLFSEPLDYPFQPDIIPIVITSSENLVLTPIASDTNQHYDYAYKNKDNTFEIRYIFYRISKKVKIFDDLEILYPLFAQSILLNIAGENNNILSTSNLPDAEIHKIYNADKGFQSFVQGGGSAFSKDYKFLQIYFYFNKTHGIVCQVILYNDNTVTKDPDFIKDCETFRFPD